MSPNFLIYPTPIHNPLSATTFGLLITGTHAPWRPQCNCARFALNKPRKEIHFCGLHISLFALGCDPKASHMRRCFCTVELLIACVHGVIILSPTGKAVLLAGSKTPKINRIWMCSCVYRLVFTLLVCMNGPSRLSVLFFIRVTKQLDVFLSPFLMTLNCQAGTHTHTLPRWQTRWL